LPFGFEQVLLVCQFGAIFVEQRLDGVDDSDDQFFWFKNRRLMGGRQVSTVDYFLPPS